MENTEDEGHTGSKHDEKEHRSIQGDEKARLEEYKKFIDLKAALRQSNLNPERPDVNHLMSLGSSSENNAEVMEKLKVINDEVKEGLIAELKSVNLTKCVVETVSFICEANLSSTGIQAAIEICSALHQRYIDFSACLIQGLLKVFFLEKSAESCLDKDARAKKKEDTLKLLIELFFVGIVEDICCFRTIIEDLTSLEHLKDRKATETNLSLLAIFAYEGEVFLGLQEHEEDAHYEYYMEVLSRFYKSLHITSDQKKFFKEALCSYCESTIKKSIDEKLKKSIDELLRRVSMDNRGEKILESTSELPVDIIRDMIYPMLPACDVLRARLIAKNWNIAYLDGVNPPVSQLNPPLSLGQTQPTRGGSIPLGFLLATDALQRCATAGMTTPRRSRGLEDEFPARHPRIISACYGFYCVFLNNPEEMVIWNPAVGQKRVISPPVNSEESHYTGMAVSFQEGVQIVNRYWVIVPYVPIFVNIGSANPRVRFRVWNSEEEAWKTNPTIIDLEEFRPRNAVTIDETVYFHISRNEVVFFNVGVGQPERLVIPIKLLGAVEIALCKSQGSLGIMSYDMTKENIQIHLLDGDVWTRSVIISMEKEVERNRLCFRSLSYDLRSREKEETWEPLLDIGLVGYADPGWLLISQRNGYILLNHIAETARRLHLRELGRKIVPGAERLFFVSHTSSFLRLV